MPVASDAVAANPKQQQLRGGKSPKPSGQHELLKAEPIEMAWPYSLMHCATLLVPGVVLLGQVVAGQRSFWQCPHGVIHVGCLFACHSQLLHWIFLACVALWLTVVLLWPVNAVANTA